MPRERTQQAYAEAFSAHTDFCRNTIGVTGFPLGRIVDIPDLTRPDDFYYTKLLTWISPPKSLAPWGDRVIRKPKGNYAVILHQGGTSTVAGRVGFPSSSTPALIWAACSSVIPGRTVTR